MLQTKYVVFNSWDDFEEIVIFSPRLNHKDMAHGMRGEVLSAGFMQISDGKAFCFGESESLGIKSREDTDSLLANETLFLA